VHDHIPGSLNDFKRALHPSDVMEVRFEVRKIALDYGAKIREHCVLDRIFASLYVPTNFLF
jgi:hypothetical protein